MASSTPYRRGCRVSKHTHYCGQKTLYLDQEGYVLSRSDNPFQNHRQTHAVDADLVIGPTTDWFEGSSLGHYFLSSSPLCILERTEGLQNNPSSTICRRRGLSDYCRWCHTAIKVKAGCARRNDRSVVVVLPSTLSGRVSV